MSEKQISRKCLVLTQSRNQSEYNDFVGNLYHFPSKYLGQFKDTPIEFVYLEPSEKGVEGVYFGFGRITGKPVADKKDPNNFFVEISDYKIFSRPVPSLDENGVHREVSSSHFNRQNAVRKINGQLLDEICLDGALQLNFRADAHLIKVLGEQLIASEKVGILELIKNAYDAGASLCTVRIENIPNLPAAEGESGDYLDFTGPVIVIEDDGSGMTREVIEKGWLRPASTIKSSVKERIRQERQRALKAGKLGPYDMLMSEIKRESGGRIPLGEKGVGRFASHRLGNRLMLKTKVAELDYEYVLEVDWDNFEPDGDTPRDLESVGVKLSRQKPTRDYGVKGSGTQLIIYGGRAGFNWDATTVSDLQRSINSLNSPRPVSLSKEVSLPFAAQLVCPQVRNLPIENPLDSFDPIFVFDGLVDENGLLEYTLIFQPPKSVPMPRQIFEGREFDLRKVNQNFWNNNGDDGIRSPESGAFFLHVDVWYRREPWVDRNGPEGKEFIDYLTNFGGISIYRDGINIFPAEWGAETDWLNLSKRHIKQAFRMSYYNMVGNLEIDQTDNIDLIDKTNREGLIENQAFKDLTELVQAVIVTVIELEFIGKRNQFTELTGALIRDPRVLNDYAKQGAALVGGIQDRYPLDDDPFNILEPIGEIGERGPKLINLSNSLSNLQKSIDVIVESQDILTEQAGYGMAVAVSVHEIAKIAANFYAGVSHLLRSGTPDVKKLQNLREASDSLQSELKRLSPLRAIRNESKSEVNISRVMEYVLDVFRARFDKLNIEVRINEENDFLVYARFGTLIQIFSNLLDNSVYWLGMVAKDARKIEILVDANERTVIVADSGPGIDQVILPYLFQAGYSLRIPPSGLGLYVSKHYMREIKGDIYVSHKRERIALLQGAQFTIDFSKVASDQVPMERK